MSELAGMDKRAQAGAEALRRGRPDAARDIYLELTGIWPSNAEAWHGLALACRALEETDGEMAALDRLLAVDPDHIAALLMKADHFARTGDGRAAHAFYSEAATRGTAQPGITPSLRAEVKRAERERERLSTSFDHHLEAALAKAGFDPARSSPRFARSLDLLFGRRKIYLQSPTAFYFPGLPQREFYERHEFSWLSELEAKTPAIREELLEVLCQEAAFEPYVRSTGARPKREYGQLLDSPEWSAFYIIRFGEMVEDAARLCPATLEALRCAPDLVLMDIRMPELDGIEATRRLLPQLPASRALSAICLLSFRRAVDCEWVARSALGEKARH